MYGANASPPTDKRIYDGALVCPAPAPERGPLQFRQLRMHVGIAFPLLPQGPQGGIRFVLAQFPLRTSVGAACRLAPSRPARCGETIEFRNHAEAESLLAVAVPSCAARVKSPGKLNSRHTPPAVVFTTWRTTLPPISRRRISAALSSVPPAGCPNRPHPLRAASPCPRVLNAYCDPARGGLPTTQTLSSKRRYRGDRQASFLRHRPTAVPCSQRASTEVLAASTALTWRAVLPRLPPCGAGRETDLRRCPDLSMLDPS